MNLPDASGGARAGTTVALLPATSRALGYRVARAQRDGRAPSVVAGVVRDGSLAWSGVAGSTGSPAGDHAPEDVAYRIGSITKTFTAVLVLQLRDEGRLRLTDPIGDHLPEVGGSATLLQLLSHSSGLTSELPGPWWERVQGAGFAGVAQSLAGEPPRLEAGARFHYSNVGFALLGEVVARLRRAAWADVLQQRLLDPLGMTRTSLLPEPPAAVGWAVHPHADVLLTEPSTSAGAMGPAGQLWSTVADLARWTAFLNAGADDVLAGDTLTEMTQPASVDDGASWAVAWGLGLQLARSGGRRLVGHGGSMPGFLAGLWAEPATGDGAVTLANATSGVAVGRLTEDLLTILAEQEPPWPRPWRPAAVPAGLLALTGTWYWGTSPVTLSLDGSRLRLSGSRDARSSTFRATGVDTWTGEDSYYAGEQLRLVRAGDGTPSHLDLATFVFTRAPYEHPTAIPGGLDDAGWQAPD